MQHWAIGPTQGAGYRGGVPDLVIRPYEDEDEARVLPLLAASLGKEVDDRYRRFFRWKHLENPVGRSYMWVGELDGQLVGFRAFLRWRFRSDSGEVVDAVRAVDTATHPDAQGLGIFRTLTLHGLDEMRPLGVSFVFNTPNGQSRPGYLKMGWELAGRAPVRVRPRSLLTLRRVAGARTAAEPWSLPVEVGQPVDAQVGALAGDARGGDGRGGLVTDRTPEFILWRYGACDSVASRAVPAGAGVVLVRFRRRGPAVECTVGDVLGATDRRAAGRAVRQAMRAAGADFALAAASAPVGGMVRSTRLGPIQTRRSVADEPSRAPLALSLGDVALF